MRSLPGWGLGSRRRDRASPPPGSPSSPSPGRVARPPRGCARRDPARARHWHPPRPRGGGRATSSRIAAKLPTAAPAHPDGHPEPEGRHVAANLRVARSHHCAASIAAPPDPRAMIQTQMRAGPGRKRGLTRSSSREPALRVAPADAAHPALSDRATRALADRGPQRKATAPRAAHDALDADRMSAGAQTRAVADRRARRIDRSRGRRPGRGERQGQRGVSAPAAVIPLIRLGLSRRAGGGYRARRRARPRPRAWRPRARCGNRLPDPRRKGWDKAAARHVPRRPPALPRRRP